MKKEQNLWHIHSTKENSLEYILPKRDYDRFWEEGKLQAKEIQPKIKETDTVLEYGCGVGRILTNIKCKKKYGADISKNYLDRIEDEKIIPLNSNGRRLELKNETIDFIYSIMVFQHIPYEHHFEILNELLRVLKKGGKIYIQFPKKTDKFFSYYKETDFVNTYSVGDIYEHIHKLKFADFKITEGNLVAYGENGSFSPDEDLEFFLTLTK
ncbi:class I SAM-dependent methyltransferase [Candidatus Woesearchaeota archaeon]|nr:class I SAM-dependent methyltransferase [Candidatus Woesearchaeota archaeon]